ncbi:PAS domain S-box protein [Rhodopseudomonas sp. HC1]|uniref:PAS domain S-box protein n=1 Tax=Rhodopseudomonas infernalis TaxID=2897386 RepID=UPI001EE93D7E|nr:PAS domain-containing hybrid sensor histidine kinase/response regulator [Rhodopseudomonas infernalis]MCG6204805.1 PAS domain S-box protein [Rhodopseudomonas infernalis]
MIVALSVVAGRIASADVPSWEALGSWALDIPWWILASSLAIGLLIAGLIELHLTRFERRNARTRHYAHLAAIVECSSYAIVGKSLDGSVLSWNKAAELLFGYTADQAIGRNASDLIVPDELREEERQMLAGMQDGTCFAYLWTKRRKANGDLVDVAVSISPMRSDDGTLIGMAASARDITDLVQAEREIHNLNASLERQVAERTAQLEKTLTLQTAILERAAYAVIATDVSGTITLFNPAAERMLGYKAQEMIGQATAMLFHDPDELAERAAAMRSEGVHVASNAGVLRARLARNDPDTAVWTYIDRQGNRIPVRLTLSLLRSKDGTNLGVLGIAIDLTEQLKYEDELKAARATAEQASAAKADFLANMSHEIRTPLNGIIGYSDLLLEDQTLAPDTRRQVTRIFEASDSLRVIIDDILDFSKIEACGVKLESKPLYIPELIANCASIIEPKADEKGLRLIAATRSTLPVLIGDAARLRQVLLNLMNNAVKFTAAGSVELIVSCVSRVDDVVRLRIAVTDTGIGISPDEQNGLFKRFSQADETISRKYGGTGLGLAISQRIVHAMQGELKIESEPGIGSTFAFEIDLPVAEQIDIDRHDAPVQSSRRARILVVDDVEMNRDLCRTMLCRAGHQVDLADSGSTAIAMTSSRVYDLIFMDVQMGEMDGLEATRRIRARGVGPSTVPIIALTANVLPEQVARYKAAGMDDHLGKPINRVELLACVARWIDGGVANLPSVPLAPSAAGPDLPVRDQDALDDLRLFADDQVIAGFAAQLSETIARMEPRAPHDEPAVAPGIGAFDPAEREALGAIAHKTISLAGQLGFVQLAEACRRMEMACSEHAHDVPELYVTLQIAIDNAKAELEALQSVAS